MFPLLIAAAFILLERKDILDNPQVDDEAFDVAVEDAISDRPAAKRIKTRPHPQGGRAKVEKGKISRHVRDQKYGFGGARKRWKQNTRDSTDNVGEKGAKGAKSGFMGRASSRGSNKRLGKSRRIAARSKR